VDNKCKRCKNTGTPISQWFDLFARHSITLLISISTGQPCDADGYELPRDTPPTPEEPRADDDYFPYSSRPEFELADLLFRKVQMSGSKISDLMDIWAAYQQIYDINASPPFASSQDLYNTIDSMEIGDVAWEAFAVEFDGEVSDLDDMRTPPWKRKSFEVWFRDPLKIAEAQIANKDFTREMDYAPKQMFSRAGKRQYLDFMSGNWAWEQAVRIALVHCVCEFLILFFHIGHYCHGPRDPWIDVCTNYSGKRQDYGFGSHRAKRLLSFVCLDRECPEPCKEGPSKCSEPCRVPCNSKEWGFACQ
jgi:hypothetical protein